MANDGTDLGWRLSTAIVLFHEAVARRLGLGVADHKALGLIARNGPLPAGALASALGVGPSAVTGVIDRLENAGYVRRVPDPSDRRRVLVVAEPDRHGLGAIFADLGRDMAAFVQRYDEREIAAIVDYLERTIEVLETHTARLAEEDPASGGRR